MASILLIEDNQNNADYVIRILEGVGHTVAHHLRGLDGSRAARRSRPDLILLDFNLPDIDGTTLSLSLKKNLGGSEAPPIVAATARNSAIDRSLAARYGFAAFIGKPFEPEELIEVVEAILKEAAAKAAADKQSA
ncbi:MAG: response regulator [Chloroflexi bacterium]|nr:response regulator [Chloroflexota bacterium]